MILRSLATALHKQDWTTVIIELLMVIVGVFLGIQVANWNEARAEQTRTAEQLASFREELMLARYNLAARQRYYEDRIASAAELRDLLESNREVAPGTVYQLAVSTIRGAGLDVAFQGYEEITATGTMSKVDDEQLRKLLHQWGTQLTRINNADKVLEDTRITLIIPIVLEATSFGNVLQADERYRDLTVAKRFELDLEDLRQNREFDGPLAMRQVQAEQQVNSLLGFIKSTEALIQALGAGCTGTSDCS
jgi:hypothetical protein